MRNLRLMITNCTRACEVSVNSETGRLRAVLLHRPGVEIERMTPLNASHALYSDILSKHNADREYKRFSDVLERWTQVYYVEDILPQLLHDPAIRHTLATPQIEEWAAAQAAQMGDNSEQALAEHLSRILIEGYEDPAWDGVTDHRYLVEPLYNLFFTRDASSTIYNRVLINSMSFPVRERETHIYEAIFRHFFHVDMLNTLAWNPSARTEGGDVQVASPDLLCIGQGIRTNNKGIDYLAQTFAREREHFHILVQQLPHEPESFIHLDMVFTFLSRHHCMAFEPMLKKQGLFAAMPTTLISIDHGNITYREVHDLVDGLRTLGWDITPVICGGTDPWVQLREQWHSGANFFALGEDKVLGYRRNVRTIDALNHAGFDVLNAEDVVSGKENMDNHDKFVVAFPASELPRAGGGARCMTMPLLRD
ncbi:MAG: arginine deiminase [Muribaculaceae bacterium]|nr:arginine deiminase [Muribaculaceae bacterium]